MRALKARNLADKTLRIHGDSLTALVDHADAAQLGDLGRDAVRAFLADLTDRFRAGDRVGPLPRAAAVLQVVRSRGGAGPLPHGRHATTLES